MMVVSYDVSTWTLPICQYPSQRSFHRQTAVANPSAAMNMGPRSYIFLMVSEPRERPASSSFNLLNKNKAACDRFGEYGSS